MKNKGFIKLYRNVLSKPEMTDLVAKHGAEGFGVYMMLMIYLSQCDDYEGPFTNGLLSSIAVRPTSRANTCAISPAISNCSRLTENGSGPLQDSVKIQSGMKVKPKTHLRVLIGMQAKI